MEITNMKKFFVVLLSICLFVLPVMAQTQDDPEVVKWEDLEESFIETGYGGGFWNISNLGISIMIPNGLNQLELSQDYIDNGFVEIFATDDLDIAVLISLRDLACETLPDVANLVLENIEDAQIIGYYNYNGLDAMMFLNPGNEELTSVIGTTEPGYYIQVSIKPITNEEINKLSGFIFGSIQPIAEN